MSGEQWLVPPAGANHGIRDWDKKSDILVVRKLAGDRIFGPAGPRIVFKSLENASNSSIFMAF